MKTYIHKYLSILGIYLSFIILDILVRINLFNELNYYSIYSIIPNLFSSSWIILIMGIIYLLPKRLKIITYTISFFSIFLSMYNYINSIYFIIPVIIYGITIFNIIKETNLSRKKLDLIIIILTTIILSASFKGIALLKLGPEVISSNETTKEYLKNTYLHTKDDKKLIELSGYYEYEYKSIKKNISNSFKINKDKINNNYSKKN